MNYQAIRVIYKYEMLRAWKTLMQTIASPVISTSLYFVVFGSAIGSRIQEIEGVSYGLFIVPGLVMLSLLTQSISNASFGIFFALFAFFVYLGEEFPLEPIKNRTKWSDQYDYDEVNPEVSLRDIPGSPQN